MALARVHTTAADGTFSATGAVAWNAAHGVTGAVSGGIPYFSSTTAEATSALLDQYGVVIGGGAGAAPATSSGLTFGGAAAGTGLAIAAGTATGAGVAAETITRTNNNAAVDTGVKWTFTDTTSAAGFLPFQILGTSTGAANLFSVSKTGKIAFASTDGAVSATNLQIGGVNNGYWSPSGAPSFAFGGAEIYTVGSAGMRYSSTIPLGWSSDNTPSDTLNDTAISRGGANQIVSNGGTNGGGTTTSRAEINKLVTAIANNTATATFTVTIPNGAHSAGGKFILKGAAGAGGAIGADEFSAVIEYDWVVARTTGVNAVATLSTAVITGITASVAGGATPTIAAALSAISGAVGAVNTFTLNVTINALTGASTNHTCFCYGSVLNDNASGVTIA